MRLKNKIAIITGGASGMGASTARIFAREGAKVVVTDLLVDEIAQIVDEIGQSGGSARFQKLYVSSETDWDSVVTTAMATEGRIDILINNAGVSGSHPDKLNTDTWDQQMNINAKGVFLGMRAVIPEMDKT